MEELADIHRRGNTIIMVTHNPDLTSYASRIITMLDGKIDTDSTKNKAAPFKKQLNLTKSNKKPAPRQITKKSTKKPSGRSKR